MDNVTAQHTPGPWTIRYGTNLFSESGRLVANTGGHSSNVRALDEHDINVANARLIAAAPELLAAAKLVIAFAREHGGTNDYKALLDLDNACAKAEGREA